jgi:hypothetical protein
MRPIVMIPACALTIRGIARERVDGVVYVPCVGAALVAAGEDQLLQGDDI